ncbi:hypothetical protein BESB_065940 [Besnoitia besnoiti]|uniref:Uncharacterized protein n=1 Tax=Besnoitia besnoiti TaxID=94643 RepID=A0A2A9ME64_BESBE|nr:hypothetical protein BESB_065940 [Besnoitia besnoiti]PFH34561.1 hypothetical protein BESB_065940 [Besnoitia besnoiti]
MVKCRGFKPQGMVLNPIRRVVSSGPSLMEKLQRDSRPTWDELRKMLKKKEESANEFLERYENEQFADQLEHFRNAKIEAQEKQHLELLRQEAKQRRKRARDDRVSSAESSDASSSSDSRSADGEKASSSAKKKRKTEKKKKDKKKEKKKHRADKKKKSKKCDSGKDDAAAAAAHNPYRLSNFFSQVCGAEGSSKP